MKPTLKIFEKAWLLPVLGGIGVGLLNLFHYLFSSAIDGVNVKFGFFPGGSIVLAPEWIMGKSISPEYKAIVMLGVGIVVGSFISSVLSGDSWLRNFKKGRLSIRKIFQAFLGGAFMGFGILISDGCLIRHALTGVPTLQISSIITFASMILGMWFGLKLLERWLW